MSAVPVTVRTKGRVVVPTEIRRELGIEEGMELMARIEGRKCARGRCRAGRRRRSEREQAPGSEARTGEILFSSTLGVSTKIGATA